MPTAYPIDHLVLPTVDLSTARARLGKLGFTVAPDARHPFGTENACVFLADGTYLEPLAVASLAECVAASLGGNVFTARDQAFRFRQGEDGFSALVFGTGDAGGDDRRLREKALSAGPMLEFTRPMRMPDGAESIAGFRLAFAADLRAPDFFVFSCERINALPADRSMLETHANGVVAITRIVLSAHTPAAFSAFLGEAGHAAAFTPNSFGMTVETGNVPIDLLDGKGMDALYDMGSNDLGNGEDAGLRGRAIVFASGDLSVTEALLAANGVSYTRKSNTILVKAAPGQGALFAFEERA
jgi:hypothetical protein